MGAKSWMIAYSQGRPRDILASRPQLDPAGTDALVADLFGRDEPSRLGETDLFAINPPDNEIVAGAFESLFIVAAREFSLDNPSQLKPRFLERAPAPDVYLHAMHSVVDWSAFAVWQGGELRRSLSLAPDFGIVEDIGQRMAFEQSYWNGSHPPSRPKKTSTYSRSIRWISPKRYWRSCSASF